MSDDAKPLTTAGSYTLDDLGDDFDPNDTKPKTPINPRGSFTILPNDSEPEVENPGNLTVSFDVHDKSHSNYEECHGDSNFHEEQPIEAKGSFNLEDSYEPPDEPKITNPTGSYVIKDRSFDRSTGEQEEEEYDEDNEDPQQDTVYDHSHHSNNMDDMPVVEMPYPAEIDSGREALLSPIKAANDELVNKSFTINDPPVMNSTDSLGDSKEFYPNQDVIRARQDPTLNASYDVDPSQTFRRPVMNKNENRQLSDSYTIQDNNEKNKILIKENSALQNQIKELSLCIHEYEKFLNLTLQNKQKSEGSNNVSMTTLLTERDQALEEAANIGKAFSDLQNRHERSKDLLKFYKENEAKLNKAIKELEEWSEKQLKKYDDLKQKAEEKITRLNEDFVKEKKTMQEEMERLQTTLKFQEIRMQSLETDIKQKSQQNNELTEMCEYLIKKNEEG